MPCNASAATAAVQNLLNGPLKNFTVPYGKGTEITTSDGSNAYVAQPTLRYDAKRDVMVSLISGAVYRDELKELERASDSYLNVLEIEPVQVFFHCGKSLIRSRLWEPSQWPDRTGLASLGVALADQIGTIDALLAQLCIRYHLVLLTTDQDFRHAAGHCALKVWSH